MAELKANVLLSLKDIFSQAMSKAAGAAGGFADKTLGAIDKIDKAVSGTGAKLAALGLTLSLGAAAKGVIELDHRMTRLGISAGASADKVSKLKQLIFDTAQAPDIKIDANNLLDAIDTVVNKTNDLKYAEDNIQNIAYAIQATGESGESIGNIFSEFQKFGYSTEQIISLMDDLAAQANEGSFSLADFAKQAPAIFSSLEGRKIGTAPENIKKVNAALQILNAGMKSPEKAASSLYAAMNELADIETQKKLKRMGIDVLDKDTKEFRDFNDIMLDIAAKSENARDMNYLNSIFSNSTLQAIRSYTAHGERMYENLTDLGDTTGLLQRQSAEMADTLQSNIKNLQTAFNSFANSNLTKPLEYLTGLLNKLSEDPERLKNIFSGIAYGIGAIAAVKGIAGITRFIGSLSQLQGGKIDLGSLSMASAMPVYVTNWGSSGIPAGGMGGSGTGAPLPQTQLGKGTPLTNARAAVSNLKPAQYAAGGAIAGIGAAFIKIPQMVNELDQIKQNEDLTSKERGKAKGGAIGDAAGSTIGAAGGAVAGTLLGAIAAGALSGTAIGTAIPGLGNIAGLLIGGAVGAAGFYFGGKLGRKAGEGIGEAAAKDDQINSEYSFSAHELPEQLTQTVTNISQQEVELGHADINLNVNLTGDRPAVTAVIQNNTMPARFNTGSRTELRSLMS
ncbi:MAG: hypothetical protein FWC03_11505 [Treponema sp.]|nr:hypothetical protein [Treponema sp.]